MGTLKNDSINGVVLTPLKRIDVVGGDVFHGMKVTDDGYMSFGETYFTTIEKDFIKGWKRHNVMTVNLIVISGEVKFVVSKEGECFYETTLSPDSNYARLTIAPGLWFGFQGIGAGKNMVANISSHVHNPEECDIVPISDYDFVW